MKLRLISEGEHKDAFGTHKWKTYAQIPTNADKIRAMTDEELTEFFQNTTFCDSCFIFKNECGTERYSCKQRWLDWLKQEAQCTSG